MSRTELREARTEAKEAIEELDSDWDGLKWELEDAIATLADVRDRIKEHRAARIVLRAKLDALKTVKV